MYQTSFFQLFFKRDPILQTNFSDCPKICNSCQNWHHAFVKGEVDEREKPGPR